MAKRSRKDKSILTVEVDVISQIDRELNIDSFYSLAPEVIDLAYEEARNRVNAVAASIDLIQDRMMTLLGWFAAAEISIIGVLVGLVASDTHNQLCLILAIYGAIAIGGILIYLVRKGLYGTEVVDPGDTPDHFLEKEIVDKLKIVENPEEQKKKAKIMYLSMLQDAANRNYNTNKRLVKVYRSIIWATLGAAALGAVVLLLLALFF